MAFKDLKEIKASLVKTGYPDYPAYLVLKAKEAKEVLLEPLLSPIPETISPSKAKKVLKESGAEEDDLGHPVQ